MQHSMVALNHIIVFFANGHGDHFMSTPSLRAISTIPSRRLTFIWPDGLREAFFTDLGGVEYREFKSYVRHGRKCFDISSITDGLSQADAFVCLQPWCSEDIRTLIERIRPGQTIGFHQSFDVVVERGGSEHYVDGIFRLATALCPKAKLADFSQKPTVPMHWRLRSQSILATLPIGTRLLAWHADTKIHKQWSPSKFADVLLEFLKRHSEYFAIGVGFNNLAVRRMARHERLIAIDGLPLITNLGLLSASHLFLGIDSCMLHAADLLRIPGVGLFGPPHNAPDGSDSFGFRFGPHIHISGQGSIENIREKEVLQALSQLTPA
jgi:hypothetical protein